VARSGEILFAELRLSGVRHRLYRFKAEDRRAEYFDYKGRSAQKALMKTPIDGARLSSGYGRRRHPILGYTRMHRGIDFAAPRGTPVYSAGNGTVVRAGRNGSYGKYIRIRHNGRYSTAYAHLNGYARGLRKGRRVRQGQIVGYVGSTGRSTGPHLHYEILVGNRQVNPFRIKLPSGRRLGGRELKEFKAARDDIEQRLAGLPSTIKVTGR
jgi:murein DD-endopeptidase MepM/ murein hydrolase activator NlpD